MQHVDNTAVKYFDTLNTAQKLYMDSMRIALDPLHTVNASDVSSPEQDMLKVDLRVDVRRWVSAQLTLSVSTSSTNTKVFVFKPGSSPPAIPMSARRPTLVSTQCYSDGQKISEDEGRSWVVFLNLSDKKQLENGPVSISGSPEEHNLTILLRSGSHAFTFRIPFATYAAEDVSCAPNTTGYTMCNAFDDFNTLMSRPLIMATRPLSFTSAEDAEKLLGKAEETVLKLNGIFDSVFSATAKQEFGAQDSNQVVSTVDWSKSFIVSTDACVQDLITTTKDLYTFLLQVSNTAVDSSWLTDVLARRIITRREQLAQSVQGRRSDLASVARVRCTFTCIGAIDNALRRACRLRDEPDPLTIDAALETFCHEYWIKQMKSNKHNSVTLDDNTFNEAVELMRDCRNLRDGRRLLPVPITTAIKSSLGGAIWRSMHLQGLAASHVLPMAPCAHFMYKQRARVDYTAHPVVAGAVAQTVPLALFTMLVCSDVEHRIIPPRLGSHILTLLQEATGKDATQESRERANAYLRVVLHPSLHSLADAAVAASFRTPYDLSFLSAGGPQTTGYDMAVVSTFCLQSLCP